MSMFVCGQLCVLLGGKGVKAPLIPVSKDESRVGCEVVTIYVHSRIIDEQVKWKWKGVLYDSKWMLHLLFYLYI